MRPLVLCEASEFQRHCRAKSAKGLSVGLVPTMGALHPGHLSLVEKASALADVVVASIFVNPLQFAPSEDLARYPRDLEGDLARLESAGVDAVFVPDPGAMYPAGFETSVIVSQTSAGLCGGLRPGHFEGVATVVLKLLHLARPKVAVFGEKDFQQLAVIRAMVRDLDLEHDTRIVSAPTVRESDGLAMSSRNAYLTPAERDRARGIPAALAAAQDAYDRGERQAGALIAVAAEVMRGAAIVPQYLELRRFSDLAPLDRADGPSVLLTAAMVGSTRLIDNRILERP